MNWENQLLTYFENPVFAILATTASIGVLTLSLKNSNYLLRALFGLNAVSVILLSVIAHLSIPGVDRPESYTQDQLKIICASIDCVD